MLKLFIKKPLWAVGFAAAAIFAVTFVACDSSTTNNVVGGFTPGHAVEWIDLATGETAEWTLVQPSGVPVPPTTGHYYKTKGDVVPKLAADNKIASGFAAGTAVRVYWVNDGYEAPDTTNDGVQVVGAEGVLTGVTGSYYVVLPIEGYSVGDGEDITASAANTWYEIDVLAPAAATVYLKSSADSKLTTTSSAVYKIVKAIPATSIFGDGTGTPAANSDNVITSWAVENDVVYLTQIAGTTDSNLDKYVKVATGNKITLAQTSAVFIIEKVLNLNTPALNTMTTTTKWYKFTVYKSDGSKVDAAYFAGVNSSGPDLDSAYSSNLGYTSSGEASETILGETSGSITTEFAPGTLISAAKIGDAGALDTPALFRVGADKKAKTSASGSDNFVVAKVADAGTFDKY